MEMDGHESDLDGSVSNNDEELSDIHDEDSDDHLSRVQEDGNDADILSKLKQQVRNMERSEDHIQNQTPPTPHENPPGLSPFPHQFPLPLPFPFPHPAAAAFLPPVSGGHVPAYPAAPPHNSSGSSHSSESSNSSQQQTWSFEEQFKQVRQLYEINDDPKRKEFLDDLFSFMQKRAFVGKPRVAMRTPILKSTSEEIKRKLLLLYSDSLDNSRDVLDFDKKYDFFSTDESLVLKFSSNWFRPEKYGSTMGSANGKRQNLRLIQNDGSNPRAWPQLKQESLLRIEKAVGTTSLPRDLEILGRTPYHIGVDGEKFRVVAATLQKCNSPLVRRTFHFTSNGIVEASERKNEMESALSFVKQTKGVATTPKFVRIKRFRVIKKDDAVVDKYVFPQKIKLTNGDKTRFLTVRIRPKVTNAVNGENPKIKLEAPSNEDKSVVASKEKKGAAEPNLNLVVRTEEVEEETTSEPETVILERDEGEEGKTKEVKQINQQVEQKEEKIEMFNCGNCGKQFQTYLSCLAHFRSHQRQVCQFCSKKFLTVKMLRDHIKMQHQHHNTTVETSEGRITTATSKFGRTRQVLNVAELRSKYKML